MARLTSTRLGFFKFETVFGSSRYQVRKYYEDSLGSSAYAHKKRIPSTEQSLLIHLSKWTQTINQQRRDRKTKK